MMQRVITVQRDVLAEAREDASRFREQQTRRGTLVVNLISSPGAGKTQLLEATARRWGPARRMAVPWSHRWIGTLRRRRLVSRRAT